MSGDNSIARSDRAPEQPADRAGFEIPPALAVRYQVRMVEAPGGEQRLGLFTPGNRDIPAIEITDDRIVARREDAATIAGLVEMAQHNGWVRITVEGSAAFRRAVWTSATREGLAVGGYEPTFLEQERAVQARKDAAERAGRDTVAPVLAAQPELSGTAVSAQPSSTVQARLHEEPARRPGETERRAAAQEAASAPERLADRLAGQDAPPRDLAAEQRDAAAERRRDSEALAELFLSGRPDWIAAEPRLTEALRAQAAMEQHIGEVFAGDRLGLSSATLESRQLISDALRRGLDVSAREALPVRQLEPAQPHPDPER